MTIRFSLASLILFMLAACAAKPEATAVAPPPAATAPAAQTAAAPVPVRPTWVRPDLALHWLAADGTVQYPPNDGCDGPSVRSTLQPGRLIDRFGGSGRYFSPKGEPFDERALPSVCRAQVYTVYRVVKPVQVVSCKAAPWFDEPGGATQYETDEPSAALVAEHVLEPVPDAGSAPCGAP
jgi:hypothetical protein